MSKLDPQEVVRFDATVLGADCLHCPLHKRYPVQPKDNVHARLIIVGEAPGEQEEEDGDFFVGASGRLLNRTCETFGIVRQCDLHITNALLCRPDRKLSPREWASAIRCCRSRLHRELGRIEGTKTIAAMGGRALYTLTGKPSIFPWLGAPTIGTALETKTERTKRDIHPGALVSFDKYSIVPCLHPAFTLRSPGYIPVMQTHFGRAWELANGRLKPWVWGATEIWPGKTMVAYLHAMAKSEKLIAVDVETQGIDPFHAPIMCIGLSNGEYTVSIPHKGYHNKKAGDVMGLEAYAECGEIRKLVRFILENKALVFQNGMYDITALRADGYNIKPVQWFFDTLPAHAVVAPRLKHNLDMIACVEFPMPMWKTEFGATTDQKGAEKFTSRDEQELREYNAHDAEMTNRLVKPLSERFEEYPKNAAIFERYMALMRGPAMSMTYRGITVDPSRYANHRQHFATKQEEAANALEDVGRRLGVQNLSPTKTRELHRFFFQTLGVKPNKYTDLGSPSLDEESLLGYVAHQNDSVREASQALLKYRRWKKLEDYLHMPLDEQNVLHTFWKPYGARTGRWSSSPNLQNIPKPRVETGRDGKKTITAPGLRDIFVSRDGQWLVEADYKALELRLVAYLSGDETLCKWFSDGEDVHRKVAAQIFSKTSEEVTKDERDLTKLFHYAAIYGADVGNIWKRMVVDFPSLSLMIVERMHAAWFTEHRLVYVWQQAQIRRAREELFVECPISGRRQYYLDGKIDANEVLNFPVQGSGADIIDPAFLKIHEQCDYDTLSLLLQCHDAAVMEARDPVEAYRLLKLHMEAPVLLNGKEVSFPVDVKMGKDWANMVEVKNEEEICQAMNLRNSRTR